MHLARTLHGIISNFRWSSPAFNRTAFMGARASCLLAHLPVHTRRSLMARQWIRFKMNNGVGGNLNSFPRAGGQYSVTRGLHISGQSAWISDCMDERKAKHVTDAPQEGWLREKRIAHRGLIDVQCLGVNGRHGSIHPSVLKSPGTEESGEGGDRNILLFRHFIRDLRTQTLMEGDHHFWSKASP
jgi:hypothetical protein